MKQMLMTAAVVGVCGSMVLAGERTVRAPLADRSVILGAREGSPLPTFPYFTGFEPSESFVPGPVNGQAGWLSLASQGRGDKPFINASGPISGQQDLRFTVNLNPDPGTAALAAGFSPVVPSVITDSVATSIDFNIAGLPDYVGSQYSFSGARDGASSYTFEVSIDYTGSISVRDIVLGDDDFFLTTGNWVIGQTHNLRVELDANLGQPRYFLDNTLIYTGVGGFFGPTGIDYVAIAADNWAIETETGSFDNLSIGLVPEPASLGLLALGGLMLRRRAR